MFDLMIENYDVPADMKKKKTERALSPKDIKAKQPRNPIVDSEQAGRAFRTLRRQKIDLTNQLEEKKSSALFYLVGKSPIRLALTYFDHFDGVDWTISKDVQDANRLKFREFPVGDNVWMKIDRPKKAISRDVPKWKIPRHPFFQGRENHSIKVINLSTNRILAPSSLDGWYMDKCEKSTYFGFTKDGAIEFKGRESLAEFTVYHVVSNGVNYGKLESSDLWFTNRNSVYTMIPEQVDQEKLEKLALDITPNAKTDWEKVAAVTEYLRTEFELADVSKEVEWTEDSVSKFLEDRSGPDYMFATTAVMLLRSIGIEARLGERILCRTRRL